MKAGLYCRTSTEKYQDISLQVELLKGYCSRNSLDVYWTYKDQCSAKNSDRKGYQLMLEHGIQKRFHVLLVQDLDRLLRSFKDIGALESWITVNDISLISLSDGKIDLTSAHGRFNFRIKMLLSTLYLENLHEKIKVGVAKAKAAGKYKGRKKGSKNRK